MNIRLMLFHIIDTPKKMREEWATTNTFGKTLLGHMA